MFNPWNNVLISGFRINVSLITRNLAFKWLLYYYIIIPIFSFPIKASGNISGV